MENGHAKQMLENTTSELNTYARNQRFVMILRPTTYGITAFSGLRFPLVTWRVPELQ